MLRPPKHELGRRRTSRRSPLVRVSLVTQTITLSLIIVRAFVGPRPVYSENKRTTCRLIAAGNE